MADMPGLEFERPIIELERKIEELRGLAAHKDIDISGEVSRLDEKLKGIKKDIYSI